MSLSYINARCKTILKILLEAESYITLSQLEQLTKVSKRSIYYDLCRINEWLHSYGITEIEVVRGKGILIDTDTKEQIEALTENRENEDNYVFSPMERIHMIICGLIYSEEPVYIDQLTEMCVVSRNTIFSDLRVVMNQLQDYDLKLEYEAKKGYVISGDIIKLRAVFLMNFYQIRQLYENGTLKFLEREKAEKRIIQLKEIEKKLNTTYVDGVLISLAVLFPLLERHNSALYFPDFRRKRIEQTREWKLVNLYFPELADKEKVYLCLHLLGARMTMAPQDFFEERPNQTVYELTKALVTEFENSFEFFTLSI